MKKILNKGFTLIELLVVIAVIGILAAVIMASLNTARSKARDAKRIADLKQVQTALELYRNENNSYPAGSYTTIVNWTNMLTTNLITPGYLSGVPLDPGSYIYRYYSGTYPYTCNGISWTSYEYVLTFDLENSSSTVPLTGGTAALRCFPGPLK